MAAYWFMLVLITFGICKAEVFSVKNKVLKGPIDFQDPSVAPSSIEDGSCLNVNLKDITDFTTASKLIANATMKDINEGYEQGSALKYEIEIPTDLSSDKKYSVSAVLNIGWCKDENEKIDAGNWIKENDFLTDTNFIIENLEQCSNSKSKECKGPKISLVKNPQEDVKV